METKDKLNINTELNWNGKTKDGMEINDNEDTKIYVSKEELMEMKKFPVLQPVLCRCIHNCFSLYVNWDRIFIKHARRSRKKQRLVGDQFLLLRTSLYKPAKPDQCYFIKPAQPGHYSLKKNYYFKAWPVRGKVYVR